MSRPQRIEYPGAFYHVTSCGNTRKAIYWDDNDRTAFPTVLCEVIVQHSWQCHAYCLMDNHGRPGSGFDNTVLSHPFDYFAHG